MARMQSGDLLALLGVAIFAGTYPATKFALGGGISPVENACWRAAIAGLVAAMVLRWTGIPRPAWSLVGQLALAGLCLGLVFALSVGWALQQVPSSHAAIVIAALPLATVGYARLRGLTTPTTRFWLGGLLAGTLVLIFAWRHAPAGSGGLDQADLALAVAIAGAAVGYVEGGQVAKVMPGWQVISWALVILLPLSVPLALWLAWQAPMGAITPSGWAGLAYGSLLSMYVGFFPWYAAMQRIGVTRASQIQYLQPFIAIGYGVLLLGEHVTWPDLALAIGVVAAIAWGRGGRR